MTEEAPDHIGPHVEITLGYSHQYRKVYATSVHKTKSGHYVITGWDPDANDGEGGYRSFRADKLNGSIHFDN